MGQVIVIGSINIDLVCKVARHPRPGEQVTSEPLAVIPGGKGANQAVAAARHGTPVTMLGATGRDDFGEQMRAFLKDEGVNISQVQTVDAATGTALIVVDANGENTIVYAAGANNQLVAPKDQPIGAGDVVVGQFEVPEALTIEMFEPARANGATTIFNAAPPAPMSSRLRSSTDILVVNEHELAFAAGMPDVDPNDRSALIDAVHHLNCEPDTSVVVTLGSAGVFVKTDDVERFFEAPEVQVVDTTGAGDAFIGNLAACIADGRSLLDAVSYAVQAASLSVTRAGAGPSMPTKEEVSSKQ